MKRILDVLTPALVAGTIDARSIRLVVREQRPAARRRVENALPQTIRHGNVRQRLDGRIIGDETEIAGAGWAKTYAWLRRQVKRPGQGAACPDVAKPQMRQKVQRRGIGTAVERLEANAKILRR